MSSLLRRIANAQPGPDGAPSTRDQRRARALKHRAAADLHDALRRETRYAPCPFPDPPKRVKSKELAEYLVAAAAFKRALRIHDCGLAPNSDVSAGRYMRARVAYVAAHKAAFPVQHAAILAGTGAL